MLSLSWVRCQGDVWCSLRRLNLETVSSHGVYIIWHAGQTPRVVYVGQGDVAVRLAHHRANPEIMAYEKRGTLFVTWASVPADHRHGVERYLADKYSPLVGDAHPMALPIAVNGPWG